jgi:hypothetical protein
MPSSGGSLRPGSRQSWERPEAKQVVMRLDPTNGTRLRSLCPACLGSDAYRSASAAGKDSFSSSPASTSRSGSRSRRDCVVSGSGRPASAPSLRLPAPAVSSPSSWRVPGGDRGSPPQPRPQDPLARAICRRIRSSRCSTSYRICWISSCSASASGSVAARRLSQELRALSPRTPACSGTRRLAPPPPPPQVYGSGCSRSRMRGASVPLALVVGRPPAVITVHAQPAHTAPQE